MNKKENKILIGSICALGCEFIYGLSYAFTKKATEVASPLTLLGWRFVIAAVIMTLCALVGIIKLDLRQKNIKPLIAVAVFNPVIYFICETFGISSTTASESGVLLACIPVASLMASSFFLKNKPSGVQVLGVLITLLGVLVTVFAVGTSSSFSVSGYVFLLIAVLSYSLYAVFVEKSSDYSGAEVTYIMLVAGATVFLLLALIEAVIKGNMSVLLTLPVKNGDFLLAVLYQGIGCSIIAFFLSNVSISKIGVNGASTFIGVSTVVSIIAGSVTLGEKFSVFQIVGAGIIIIGVYVANVHLFRRKN